MDRDKLVTIVVTAAITAVVTTIFKELLAGVVSFVKNLSAIKTARQTLKKIFNKTNRQILADIAWLAFVIYLLIYHIRQSPVTGFSVFSIVILVIFGFIKFAEFSWHTLNISNKRDDVSKNDS